MSRICFNLTFDSATEQAIRAFWYHIANAGTTVRGLTGYRPHITLAAYVVDNIIPYEAILAPLASNLVPFPVLLESLHWAAIRGHATGIGMRVFPEATDYRYYPFGC